MFENGCILGAPHATGSLFQLGNLPGWASNTRFSDLRRFTPIFER